MSNVTVELIPCVQVRIFGDYNRPEFVAWCQEEGIERAATGGSISHSSLIALYTAEDAEKIRRWLADEGHLPEEHYCQLSPMTS